MFRKLLPKIPISTNASSKAKRAFRQEIRPWLNQINFDAFDVNDRLYGRIVYFNHERVNVRDVHNIFKPTFDLFEKIIYRDDKAILFFEGTRLDMANSGSWFEIEIDFALG